MLPATHGPPRRRARVRSPAAKEYNHMATVTKRRGWLIAAGGTALGAALAGAFLFSNAFAVHNAPYPFELDGNVKKDTARDDWQNVFGLSAVVPPATGTPVASGASVFIHDVPTGSPAKETQYDAGKDVLDTDQWTRKDVTKVVPDKDNILDAF